MADELTSTSEWGHVGIFSLRYLNKHQPSLRRAVLRTQGHNNKRRQKRVMSLPLWSSFLPASPLPINLRLYAFICGKKTDPSLYAWCLNLFLQLPRGHPLHSPSTTFQANRSDLTSPHSRAPCG